MGDDTSTTSEMVPVGLKFTPGSAVPPAVAPLAMPVVSPIVGTPSEVVPDQPLADGIGSQLEKLAQLHTRRNRRRRVQGSKGKATRSDMRLMWNAPCVLMPAIHMNIYI